jgi:hypothetical protein
LGLVPKESPCIRDIHMLISAARRKLTSVALATEYVYKSQSFFNVIGRGGCGNFSKLHQSTRFS